MEKIVFEGENYYYQNGVLYDSSYIEVPKECANRVLAEYFRRVDYKELCEKIYFANNRTEKSGSFSRMFEHHKLRRRKILRFV